MWGVGHSVMGRRVSVTALFYPDVHEPALVHEDRFHVDKPDA